jgi:NTE family protein
VSPKIALCLPGGGAMGALYQVGALAAIEDAVEGFDANSFDLYVGNSVGASLSATLAAGIGPSSIRPTSISVSSASTCCGSISRSGGAR